MKKKCDFNMNQWCQSVKLSENETNWHHQFLTYIMNLCIIMKQY